MQRPDNEVPVSVPVHGVLNRTPEIAIALVSTLVFSTGLEWTIEAFKRSPDGVPMGGYGFGRPGTRLEPGDAVWRPVRRRQFRIKYAR